MSRFFQRGGVWVLLQSMLLASVILLAVFFRGGGFHPVVVTLGVALLLIGAGVALAGALALGKNLTPFPKPGGQAQLVRHGVYAVKGMEWEAGVPKAGRHVAGFQFP